MRKCVARMTPTETARLLLPPETVAEMAPEEVEYYASIDEAAERGTDEVFENGHPHHALYIVYKLASIAKDAARQVKQVNKK